MGYSYESYLGGDLVVVRNGFDDSWSEALAYECEAMIASPCTPTQREWGDLTDPNHLYTRTCPATQVEAFGLEALTWALRYLERPTDSRVTINRYPPWVAGEFHHDEGIEPPVALLYPYANWFDCEDVSVATNPGDIVVLNEPRRWHRGRNASDTPHDTVAIWRPVPLYARAPAPIPFQPEIWEEESAA